MDTLYINDENDFEKIRKFKNKEKVFKIIINNDITFKRKFIPLDHFDEYSIFIDGKNHTLSSIDIYDPNEKVGIFTNVSNLSVKNLIINSSYLYGGVLSGIVCGNVEHSTSLYNINLENVIVSSEAYGGGVVGFSDSLSIVDSKVYTEVHGHDVVGGVAGMVNDYLEKNCDINSILMGYGKCIDNRVGYCDHKRINPEEPKKRLFRGFHL